VLARLAVSNRSKLAILLSRSRRADDALPDVVAALDDDDARTLEVAHDDDRASFAGCARRAKSAPPCRRRRGRLVGFLDAFRAETASADVFGARRDACVRRAPRARHIAGARRRTRRCCRSA
jgi:hypothetical protein